MRTGTRSRCARRAAAALTLLAAAAGCGERPPADDALFPLGAGHRFRYSLVKAFDESERTDHETVVITNRGAEAFDGETAWRRRSDSGTEYWLRSDASGIYRVASRGPLDAEPRADNPKRYVLRKPVAVGTSWEADTLPYVLERKNELPHALRHFVKPIRMTYRVDALGQRVETPAGTFDDCVRVAGHAEIRLYVDALFQWRMIPLSALEWYCPGVGLARRERREPSPTKFMVGGTLSMELTSWQ